MSIASEVERLESAKRDLKTALESKGVTVPEGAKLDEFPALVGQIPQIDPEDYYTKSQTKSLVSWQYSTIYDLDNWAASSSTDQGNGYPWTQTVTLTPVDAQAPAITADSVFESQIGCTPTGVAETDNALRSALAIIANGNSTSGSGTITTIVQEKPEVDVPVIWTLKTEVQ